MRKIGKKGMTLVEVIASLVILSIILTPITSIFYMGYKSYFIENDRMKVQQAVKEVLNRIIEDLRVYENEHTKVDETGKSLIIKDLINFSGDGIVYLFEEDRKIILRNDVVLIDDSSVVITDFSVLEIKLDDYDSSIIKINIAARTEKSDEVRIEGSYRRKYK